MNYTRRMKPFPSYTASQTPGYTIEQWLNVTFVIANNQTCTAPVVMVDGSGYDRGTIARAEQALIESLNNGIHRYHRKPAQISG